LIYYSELVYNFVIGIVVSKKEEEI